MTDGMTYEKAIDWLKLDIKMTQFDPMTGEYKEPNWEALQVIKAQEKAIEALEEIEDLKVLMGLQRKRKYYNKFVKEVWQKERGKLSCPDFDEIYKRYFEQQAEIEKLNKAIDIHKMIADDWKYEAKRLEKIAGANNDR